MIDQPSGYGVFKTADKWIHCGTVSDGKFTAGRKVSVNFEIGWGILSNSKSTQDGYKIEKIHRFNELGVESGIYKNDKKVAEINQRFENLLQEEQDWFTWGNSRNIRI